MKDENRDLSPPSPHWLNRTVLSLGLASLFSDTSHEMATVLLPLFVTQLGAGAALLGMMEGLADLLSSLAKLTSGLLGNRLRPWRAWCSLGYLVTAVSVAGIGLIYRPVWLLLARSAAWIGRGFRGPLRDALLAEDTDKQHYGKAFGFERMGDTVGAVLGPLLGVGLFVLLSQPRPVFWYSLIPGALAALLVALGPRERYLPTQRSEGNARQQWTALPAGFKRWLLAVGLFGAGDFSKTLLILWALGKSAKIGEPGFTLLPLLMYAAYNVVGAVFAYLAGAISDRLGRRRILVCGYGAGVLAATILALSPPSLPAMVLVFFFSGVCVGTEEAVEKATGADMLSPQQRAWGFGVLATVNGVGDFVSSALVGVLWSVAGPGPAFGLAALLQLAGTVLLATQRVREAVPRQGPA